ncbi:MAG: DUF4870 domain-containing protein [Sporomusaceae bacterium]|nr:DUF4870 domain-containing protein [Sporomusaceae bacterium]
MNHITGEQKVLALLAHISYFLGGVGFILAPLVIFLLKKDDSFVYEHAKQALTAHFAILAASFIIWASCTLIIGIVFLPVLAILWLILLVTSVIGAIKAFDGESYQYPFIQRFVNKL